MKRILIVTRSFLIGGTNSSLCAFLSQVNPQDLKIDVLSRNHNGYYRDVFQNCRILTESVWINERIIFGGALKKVGNIILRTIRRFFLLFGYDLIHLYSQIAGVLLKTSQYDAVLSYQEDQSSFISDLPAKKRIAWIRSEYDRYYEIHNHVDETDIYNKINTIVCVSEFSRNSFLKFYPCFSEKTVVIHNFMDVDGLRSKAKDNISLHEDFDFSYFTIVSIGRIDRVKQFESIPLIAKEIKQLTKKPFKWFIIGGSSGDIELDSLLLQRIKENGLENVVYLLGEINNVAPYLAHASIFVHTSKSETFSRVVNEAKVLGIPPVINDYACSSEFVKDGSDGIVVNNSKMASMIVKLIDEPETLDVIRKNLEEQGYDNSVMMKQLFQLLES